MANEKILLFFHDKKPSMLQQSKGSSFIVMSMVGGGLFPPLMGRFSDITSMSQGFLAPVLLFLFIFFYAINGYNVIGNISVATQ
jgi:MFS transporter, FHS family, L-fucose permease